jgi:hypothetical protein
VARVFSALPVRALHARPPRARTNAAWSLGLLLMFGGMLGLLLVSIPPGLVRDWQVRNAALALRDGTVQDSDCSGSDLIEICSMAVAAPVGTAMVQRRVHYAFVSAQDTPSTVQVVADPAHPGWLTTDLGLDVFWNRVASLAVATVVLGGLVFGGGWVALRNYRRTKTWQSAESLPVALRLVARQRLRRLEVWTVRSEEGQTARWVVPHGSAPFTLGSADDVLGLQRIADGEVMPLDDKLRWIDLSTAEREAVLGAPPSRGLLQRQHQPPRR